MAPPLTSLKNLFQSNLSVIELLNSKRFYAFKQSLFVNMQQYGTTMRKFFSGVWMKDENVGGWGLDLGKIPMQVYISTKTQIGDLKALPCFEKAVNVLEQPTAIQIGKNNSEMDSFMVFPNAAC